MEEMYKNKHVMIFDMDGTLIDSVGIWNSVDEELIRQISRDSMVDDIDIQSQRDEALRAFASEANPYISYCALLGNKYNSELSPAEIHDLRYSIAQNYLEHSIDYKDHADIFLRKLKDSGYILAIASTTRKKNMDIYRKRNNNISSKARIDDMFSLVYTREDVSEIKPNPEVYFKILQTLHVSSDECLVFEDSLIGIEAAKEAGIECVAIYDKYSDGDRSRINQLADYIVYSYAQLV